MSTPPLPPPKDSITMVTSISPSLQSSAAFWGGDPAGESLQRVYGISFPTAARLAHWEQQQEEAAKRDHRRIGRVGPGITLGGTETGLGQAQPLQGPLDTVLPPHSSYQDLASSLRRSRSYSSFMSSVPAAASSCPGAPTSATP